MLEAERAIAASGLDDDLTMNLQVRHQLPWPFPCK
jgi:hypothetical protein